MYKVGTRIKLVRADNPDNPNIGLTGIVVPDSAAQNDQYKEGRDMVVKVDRSYRGHPDGALVPAGFCTWANTRHWEPIIPEGSNVPSEASIHELLDSKFYEKEHVV